MKYETYYQLKKTVLQESKKFILPSLNKIDTQRKQRAMNFIDRLLSENIGLDFIDVNDWSACPEPAVYVYGKRYIKFPKKVRWSNKEVR